MFYDYKKIEQKWQKVWDDANAFHAKHKRLFFAAAGNNFLHKSTQTLRGNGNDDDLCVIYRFLQITRQGDTGV